MYSLVISLVTLQIKDAFTRVPYSFLISLTSTNIEANCHQQTFYILLTLTATSFTYIKIQSGPNTDPWVKQEDISG